MTRRSPMNPGLSDSGDVHLSKTGRRNRVPKSAGPAVIRAIPGHGKGRTGVGGGLRLHEVGIEPEVRGTAKPPERPTSLNTQRILRGLLCCVILGLLAIGHIQLRFMINDGRLQHQRMQRVHRDLLQQYAVLERANAQLSDYDRLHEYATQQLHMVEVEDRPTAYITADVRTKYADPSILQAHKNSSPSRAVADAVSDWKNMSSEGFMKLVDTGRAALAGQPPHP